jgi:hypothetical protein
MKTGSLLGLAALAAFIAYCFGQPRSARLNRPRDGASRHGKAPAQPRRAPAPRRAAVPAARFPEGDPSVRH